MSLIAAHIWLKLTRRRLLLLFSPRSLCLHHHATGFRFFLNPKSLWTKTFLYNNLKDFLEFIKCLKKTKLFTSFCFCSHLKSNNTNWMKPFLLFHSWPYHLEYIKHLTKINSVLNYFYLRSGKTRKNVFVKVNFVGKNNLERNLYWLNVLCILNDMAMNERIKKVSSIFYY